VRRGVRGCFPDEDEENEEEKEKDEWGTGGSILCLNYATSEKASRSFFS